MMKIKDTAKVDRPREKLARYGSEFLKDQELLAILLGSGIAGKNVIEVAKQILSKFSKKKLLGLSFNQLKQIKGVGPAKACQILAAFELSKRVLKVDDSNTLTTIQTPKDIIAQVSYLKNHKKENFVVLYLNTRNQLINKETISIGSLNANIVHPREVFEPAISGFASSVAFVHNHPSGDPEPSEDDKKITKQLVEAGKILGIEVLDHIIIGQESFVSFKDKDLI
ncbi:MAG: DNA repair protein RadC [Candidatus Berkelbacteria bacterium Athens1014_28]|uniref:DNA repair protein RadC n=1 Tax=Candidatus Berkelbacteria bacterium Athens1014_28 TaxID=2017145 RepID=A0A554LN48_9BACT|nr:MAG: DNA repair protein RadC [Candidatus Berkelbacteria bacterium Athens1014_28]